MFKLRVGKDELTKVNLNSFIVAATLAIGMSIAYFVFQPGFSGIFMMDDEPNLSALNMGGGVTTLTHLLQFVFSNDSGALGRPLSMLSFLIDDQYWPGDPAIYKKNNLYIHLLSGFMVFLLSRLLLNAFNTKNTNYISLITTLVWLIHPLHASTVLYVIQRMTLLMSLFSLCTMFFYFLGRVELYKNTRKAFIYFFISGLFAIFAVASKENGILVLAYIFVIEVTLLTNLPRTKLFNFLYKLLIIGPLVMLACYFIYNWDGVLKGYSNRDFSLYERLLTESRVLIDYLSKIIAPRPGQGGLTNDDIAVSVNFYSPLTTIPALLMNSGLILLGLWARKRHCMLAFGILWFYMGHILESSFIALELYFEHRNYLPMVGPIITIVYYVVMLFENVALKGRLFICSLGMIFFLGCSLITFQSSTIWGEPSVLFRVWAKEHPKSPRAQRIYGQLLGVEGDYEQAIKQLIKTNRLFPTDIGVLIDALNISCAHRLDQPFSLSFLKEKIATATFNDGLSYYIERMFNLVTESRCEYITAEVLIEIIDLLIPLPRMSGETRAMILLVKAKLYIEKKDLNRAMLSLDVAYSYYPKPVLPLLQCKLLLSAGLIEEAYPFFKKAQVNTESYILKNIALKSEIEELKVKFNLLGVGTE